MKYVEMRFLFLCVRLVKQSGWFRVVLNKAVMKNRKVGDWA